MFFLCKIQDGEHSNYMVSHGIAKFWPVTTFINLLSAMTSLMCSPRFFLLTTLRRIQCFDLWEHGANPQKYPIQL